MNNHKRHYKHTAASHLARLMALLIFVVTGAGCGAQTMGENPAQQSGGVRPGVAVRYQLAQDALVSLAVYDRQGGLRRTLLSGAARKAGAHMEMWDGLDRYGAALAPGEYSWKLLSHPGLKSSFLLQVGSNRIPAWQPPVGNWHGADAVAADASGVYLGSGETEGGMRSQKTDWKGRVLWQGGTGGQDGTNDPFVWAMAVGKDRIYFLSGQRDVWFRGQDGSNIPRPALNARFEGDKRDGKYQYQTDLAAVEVTQGGAKGIEAIAVSYSEHNAIRYYRRGTPGKEADFILLDTISVPKPTSLALRSDGSLVVLSEGRVLLITGANAQPKVLIEAGELDEPNRVRVDRESGDIWVACAGKTQQVKRFTATGEFAQAFGSKGGRAAEGIFDPTGLRGIGDIAPDGKGGVVVVERAVAPRRVVHFGADGKVLHQWFGGMQFNTVGCPEPQDPRYVWYPAGYEVVRAQVDYNAGTWKPLEIYPGFATTAHVMRAAAREGLVYLLDAYGWGEIKVYDPARKTLRAAAGIGEINKLPAELRPLDWIAGKPHDQGNRFRIYLWCDLNDDGKQSRDELQYIPGWKSATPGLTPDLSFLPASGVLLKPVRFTPGGTPVYDYGQATRFQAEVSIEGGKYGQPLQLTRAAGGGWYRTLQSSRREPGHWDDFGIYFWNGKSGLNRILRYDDNFNLLWEVGRHSTDWDHRPGTQSFPNPPASAGDYVFVPEATDTEVPWYAVYDRDGLYVDDVPRLQGDDLPAFAYDAQVAGDNYGVNVWGNPANDDVLLFASGLWAAPVYRINGWKSIARQIGTVAVPAGLPAARGEGKGLIVEFFDNPNLEGQPALTRSGEAYLSYGKDVVYPPELKSPVVSLRFRGQIEAPLSEDWKIQVIGGDKAEGKVQAWAADQPFPLNKPLRLTAGQRLDVTVELRNLPNARGEGRRRVALTWESPTTEQQAIPLRFLYEPDNAPARPVDLAALTPAIEPKGLLGSWPLDDGKGVNGRNETDFSRPVQLHEGATWSREARGAMKSTLELPPGASATIRMPLPREAQSLSFWFRTSSGKVTLYDAGRFFTFYNSFVDRSLELDADGLTAQAGNSTVKVRGKFNDGQWHQVIHAFDEKGHSLTVDKLPPATGAAPLFPRTAPQTVRLVPKNSGGETVSLSNLRIYERMRGDEKMAAAKP